MDSEILQIAQWVPLIIVGLGTLIGFFIGLGRGLAKTALHLVMLCIRAAAAVILTRVLMPTVVAGLTNNASAITDDPTVVSIFETPEFAELASALAGILLGAFVFFAIFIVLLIIIKPIEWIIASRFSKEHKMRLFGGLLGLVSGFLLISLLMLPFSGTVHMVNTLVGETEIEEAEEYTDVISAMDDSDICRIQRLIGGDFIYRCVSTAPYGDGEVCLPDEVEVIAGVTDQIVVISKNSDVSKWSKTETDAIKNIAEKLSESKLLPNMIKSLFSGMNNAWKEGKSFAGIEKPELDAEFDPAVMAIIGTFANSTTESISNSIKTLADIIDVLNEDGILEYMAGEEGDSEELLKKLSEKGTLDKITEILEKDENLKVVVQEITNISLRMIAQITVDIPEDKKEEVAAVMDDFADAYNESIAGATPEEKVEIISDGIKQAVEENDIEIPEALAENIAREFVNQFGDKESITGDEVEEWLRSLLENQN